MAGAPLPTAGLYVSPPGRHGGSSDAGSSFPPGLGSDGALGLLLAWIDVLVGKCLEARRLRLGLAYRPSTDVADRDAHGAPMKAGLENVCLGAGRGHPEAQAGRLRLPVDALPLVGVALEPRHAICRKILPLGHFAIP